MSVNKLEWVNTIPAKMEDERLLIENDLLQKVSFCFPWPIKSSAWTLARFSALDIKSDGGYRWIRWSFLSDESTKTLFGGLELVNKPLPAAGISEDNAFGWKMNSWPRSEASGQLWNFSWWPSSDLYHMTSLIQWEPEEIIWWVIIENIFYNIVSGLPYLPLCVCSLCCWSVRVNQG